MNKRCYVLAIVFVIFGIAAALRPAPKEIHRTEAWLEDATPTSLDGYHMIPCDANPKQSYPRDEETYKVLEPFGIVGRVFDNGQKKFEAVVIASNSRNSFHDPHFCFPGQSWQIKDEHIVSVPTKTRGVVPMSLMRLESGTKSLLAAYCYKGPGGMAGSTADLWMKWSLANFITGEPQEGAFYRIIAQDSETKQAELLRFSADYLDSVHETSHGVL